LKATGPRESTEGHQAAPRNAADLIDRADSLLIVVDAQPGFLDRLDALVAEQIVVRIAWLVGVAVHLGIPIIVTEEEPGRNGATDGRIRDWLPAVVVPMRKDVFGLADQPDILAAVEATGRRTAVLVGLETDVCIAHSAIGLVARDYRVVVVTDASGSPGAGHAAGLDRMRDGGVLLTTVKGIHYEWVRTVKMAAEVADAVSVPDDLVL
jgi:nicotinamidase-related amidase